MTPAPNPPPVAESVEVTQVDREAVGDLLGGAAPDGLLEGRQDTLSVVQAFARHRAASHEAGRIAGVREGLERAAKVAEGERPKNPVSDWTDYARTRDFAATTIAKLIRALSKGEIDGE